MQTAKLTAHLIRNSYKKRNLQYLDKYWYGSIPSYDLEDWEYA